MRSHRRGRFATRYGRIPVEVLNSGDLGMRERDEGELQIQFHLERHSGCHSTLEVLSLSSRSTPSHSMVSHFVTLGSSFSTKSSASRLAKGPDVRTEA